jgi:hypothetical protein
VSNIFFYGLFFCALALFSSCAKSVKGYNIKSASVTIEPVILNTLNPLFFGQNYWLWIKEWGNLISGTEKHVKPLNIKFLRAGGEMNDQEIPESLSLDFMSRFASYCSNVGAQPLLQIPLASRPNVQERITRATNLLNDYAKNNPLQYVSIGNEPDIYSITFPRTDLIDWNKYINSFTNTAAAVRESFPNLRILGPDFYNWNLLGFDRLTPFLENCADYIDAVSLHYYPAWYNSMATHDLAVNDFNNIVNFYTSVRKIMDKYKPGMPLIITECQITGSGDPSKPKGDASLGTLSAGLWMADFIGISSAQKGLLSVMPWSICEYWLNSFLNPDHSPKPVFTVYRMFSNYALPHMIFCKKVAEDIRVYAYMDNAGNVSVFCLNWNKESSYSVDLSFKGKLLRNTHLTYVFKPWALTCLTISSDLARKKSYTYSMAEVNSGEGMVSNDFTICSN